MKTIDTNYFDVTEDDEMHDDEAGKEKAKLWNWCKVKQKECKLDQTRDIFVTPQTQTLCKYICATAN